MCMCVYIYNYIYIIIYIYIRGRRVALRRAVLPFRDVMLLGGTLRPWAGDAAMSFPWSESDDSIE